jgi:hypothetical protein
MRERTARALERYRTAFERGDNRASDFIVFFETYLDHQYVATEFLLRDPGLYVVPPDYLSAGMAELPRPILSTEVGEDHFIFASGTDPLETETFIFPDATPYKDGQFFRRTILSPRGTNRAFVDTVLRLERFAKAFDVAIGGARFGPIETDNLKRSLEKYFGLKALNVF